MDSIGDDEQRMPCIELQRKALATITDGQIVDVAFSAMGAMMYAFGAHPVVPCLVIPMLTAEERDRLSGEE